MCYPRLGESASLVLTTCVLAILAGVCYAQAPPPPIGWESEITPGFQPSIESVLAQHFYASQERLDAFMKGWGPQAVPVLIELYGDDTWQAFRPIIIRMLRGNDGGKATALFAARLRTVLHKHRETPLNLGELSCLCTYLAAAGANEAPALVLERFKTLAAKPKPSSEDCDEMRVLCRFLGTSGSEDDLNMLAEQLLHGHKDFREPYRHGLTREQNAKVLGILQRLVPQVEDERLKTSLERDIDRMAGRLRAQRPMAEILEKEQRGGDA